MKPDTEFKKDIEKEVGYPAAIRVKDQILDSRELCIKSKRKYNLYKSKELDTDKALAEFRVDVLELYQRLRPKFKDTEKQKKEKGTGIFALDDIEKKNSKLKFEELFDYFQQLNDKIEELEITKFEMPVIDEGKAMA